jgi:5,10-methylene-tetrahydrofolate dehydrogenase/methenyl tetrahydrofolate cyclohydrolase
MLSKLPSVSSQQVAHSVQAKIKQNMREWCLHNPQRKPHLEIMDISFNKECSPSLQQQISLAKSVGIDVNLSLFAEHKKFCSVFNYINDCNHNHLCDAMLLSTHMKKHFNGRCKDSRCINPAKDVEKKHSFYTQRFQQKQLLENGDCMSVAVWKLIYAQPGFLDTFDIVIVDDCNRRASSVCRTLSQLFYKQGVSVTNIDADNSYFHQRLQTADIVLIYASDIYITSRELKPTAVVVDLRESQSELDDQTTGRVLPCDFPTNTVFNYSDVTFVANNVILLNCVEMALQSTGTIN